MYLWFRSATTTGLGAGNTTISDLETNPEDLPRSLQCWSLNNFFVKRNNSQENYPLEESLTKIIPGNGVRPASQIRPESVVLC